MNRSTSKQIEVQIMGQSYLLACPEGGESSLLKAVERVDAAMCRIRDAGKVRARDRIAVLASLNLAFELAQKDDPPLQRHDSAAGTGVQTAPFPPNTLTQARIDDLIRRLDFALGSDGQLL